MVAKSPEAAIGKPETNTGKLKVFISYSRADTKFADELVAGLEYDGGFEVGIDRHAINEGEAWEERLRALIVGADTIVFVLSPASAASKVCQWEVEEAVRNSKRILPVLAKPVGDIPVPPALAALNYVRFDPEADGTARSFMAGMAALRNALRTDLSWLREHTRLMERAAEWNRARRVANRLLTGEDIATAKAWLDKKPQYAPDPTELHRDFIKASAEAESDRLSAERQRAEMLQRAVTRTKRALVGAVVLGLVAVGAGGLAYMRQKEAETAKHSAQAATKTAETAKTELAAKVGELQKTQTKLIAYTKQAAAAIRDNAEWKFKSILAKHNIDPAAPRQVYESPTKVAELSDAEIAGRVSDKAAEMIMEFEVTSSKAYDRKYTKPEFAGGASGITIGIGYDLGYVAKETFAKDWSGLLPPAEVELLTGAVGLLGQDARAFLPTTANIKVPFDAAMAVFRKSTLVTFGRKTNSVFPNSAQLPPDCFGALVSLVYNRGVSLKGDKRTEMLAISRLIEIGEPQAVPEQMLAMKWIWEADQSLIGVVTRREKEAKLFQQGLATVKATGTASAGLAADISKPAPSVDERLLALAREHVSQPDRQITMATDLRVALDELDLTEIVMAIEQAFEIEFSDADVAAFKSLQDVAAFIKAHTTK